MSNMSYCRFRNTLEDLEDCYEHLDKPIDNNTEEEQARQRLIRLCEKIAHEGHLPRLRQSKEREE